MSGAGEIRFRRLPAATRSSSIDGLIEIFRTTPLAGLMAVVTLGYLLGRWQVRGLALGPAAGTLIVGLGAGYFGLSLADIYGDPLPDLTVGFFGFSLFIYSVGFDAGPQFLFSLRTWRGWQFVAVGSSVVVFATFLAIALGRLLGFDGGTTAGILAGGMTSASAFAAASTEVADSARLSVAFALTYPCGVLGIVLMIAILPRLTHTDISRGAMSDEELDAAAGLPSNRLTRAFEVQQQAVIGRSLKALQLSTTTGCLISRIHRNGAVLPAVAETRLQAGDHVLADGRLEGLQRFEALVGREVYDAELRQQLPPPRRVVVTSRQVHDRTLRELDLMGRNGCMIGRIERGRQVIDPHGDVALMRGDVVEVIGQRDSVRDVANRLGRFQARSQTTDIAVYAGGIVSGLLIGDLHWMPLGLDFSLGVAGGLLLAGVTLSWLRHVAGTRTHVPWAARQLVRDLGVLLFVAETGLAGGETLLGGIELNVSRVIISGLLVTILPVVFALTLAWLLRLRAVDAWGSVSGGMTSSAALNAVKRAADSHEPAVSYATAFTVASILVTAAGQVVVRVLD